MNKRFYLTLVNDRNKQVAKLGPFASRSEMVQIRSCLSANMGMKFVPVEKDCLLMEVIEPLEGEFDERNARF